MGRQPFRLFNSWLEDPEFIAIAKVGLSKQIRGTGLFKIQGKLKAVKALIKEWSQKMGTFDKQILSAKSDLDLAKKTMESHPNSIPHQTTTLEKRNKLKALDEKEEADLKKRSKVDWLTLGDSNTRFFTMATKLRKSRNSTLKILNREGPQTVTRAHLQHKSMEYFSNLFQPPPTPLQSIPVIFLRIFTPQMNEWLTQQLLEEESRNTLFGFKTDKFPGPDGFTYEFFREMWPEVKGVVLQCAKQFFKGKPILQTTNHTLSH